MNKTLKTIICIVLALCAIFLVYKIYDGIMEPVRFNKEVEARQKWLSRGSRTSVISRLRSRV